MATNQHTYGSGEISFAEYLTGTQTPGAREYLGNTPEFTTTSAQEDLEHFDADHGIRVKDDSVVTSLTQSGSIVTDNISLGNLSRFYLGTTTSLVKAAATGAIDTVAAIQFGTYQLGVTDNVPTGVRKVSSAVVTNGLTAGALLTYVAGTDYVIDGDYGTITLLEGGTLVAGGPLKVVYNVAATKRDQVAAGNRTIEGALHFKPFNPVGPKRECFMSWVKLTPNGDFSVKGEDWLTIPFNIEILKKGVLAPVYWDGVAVTTA